MKKFSQLIAEHIKKRHITKVSLGSKVGLSDTYFTMLEKGQTPPPFDTCKKIADALSLTAGERKEFFEVAYIERNRDRDAEYLDALKRTQNLYEMSVSEIVPGDHDPVPGAPLLDWNDLPPPDISKGGPMKYKLIANNDEMEPKIEKGDGIYVDVARKPRDGDIVIAITPKDKAIIRRYREFGAHKILVTINNRLPEIVLKEQPHKIIAVVFFIGKNV